MESTCGNEMDDNKPETWEEAFSANRDGYERFEKLLSDLVEKLIKNEGISAQISSRTKSLQSLKEKLERKGKEEKPYEDPLNQITDLVGIRIITYYLEDIDLICNLIKKEFIIDEKNSLDKSAILGIDQFGYKSVHYIVSLSSPRRDLPEWNEFKKFNAEIQIRTILQHAWAEIDHEIIYKNEENIPTEIKRRMYRLMALFELADEEFQNLKLDTEGIKGKYLEDITFGNLKIELNVLSLGAYFSYTKQDEKWMEISNKIILDTLKSYKTDKKIGAIIDVEKNFQYYGYIAILERLLHKLEVKNLKELDDILKDADKWGKDALRQTFKSLLDKLIDLTCDGSYIQWFDQYSNISIIIIYAKKDLIRSNPLILDGIEPLWLIMEAVRNVSK
jgi:ppGpp synthetase/RelA/SpoT-type nucleotidyltranferase